MELQINNELFIVGGAGAGFGKAIVEELALNGGNVIAVSRTEDRLKTLLESYPDNVTYLVGDIMDEKIHNSIKELIGNRKVSGIVFNAAGPPAGLIDEIDMKIWDDAWNSIVRWKIDFTLKLLPMLKAQSYGRLLYIESVSVKEPVPNLVLSNSLRPAIVGFAKTLAREIADCGITVNVLAPGYHSTAAMERLFVKKAELEEISVEAAKKIMEKEIPVGQMGKPEEMATLACWLLSPLSRYVTGQTFTHDGGMVKSIFG